MKLIFCNRCADVVRLVSEHRTCKCGESGGHYIDEINAVYSGSAIPLGIDNASITEAIRHQPRNGLGKKFTAFVIAVECSTFKME